MPEGLQSYHARSLDIVLLQETRFPTSYTPPFLHCNFPTFYLANADSKKRGVAILLAKLILFVHTHTVKDTDGRYILIKGLIKGESIISYYAPNQGQAHIFASKLSTLSPLLIGRVIIGGDSNIRFDIRLDKSTQDKPHLKQPPK